MNPRQRRYDESIITGTVSGGIVSVFTGAVEFNLTAEIGGIISLVFAACYAAYRRLSYGKPIEFEHVWEENRKSIVQHLLSIMDDDYIVMDKIFNKLDSEKFDFKTESTKITFETHNLIDYDEVKQRFENLPLLQVVLGFITYEQYFTIYNYMKNSTIFIDLYHKQIYQKSILKARSDEAKKILEFFKDEEKDHTVLREWKKRFKELLKE